MAVMAKHFAVAEPVVPADGLCRPMVEFCAAEAATIDAARAAPGVWMRHPGAFASPTGPSIGLILDQI